MIKCWQLPNTWNWLTISDIADQSKNSIVDGPFGSNLKTSDYIEDGIPVLQGKNITNNEFKWFDVRFISEKKAEELYRSSVKVGDILIIKIGSIGYAAELTDLKGYPYAIIPANVAKLKINSKLVTKEYILHWLATKHVARHFYNIASKTAQPALSLGKIKELPIPVPPLPEQKRIAAILDKADSLRRKNQQAIQLADKFLRAVFLDMFGDPVTNPKGWDVKELKDGIISIKSGWSANGESIPCNSEQLGVLKISAVTSGVFKASENKYVPSETIPKNKALIFPKKGDLLFSRANTRELVAATCIVPESNHNVFLPDKLWKVETNKVKLMPEFLHYSIQQPRFRELLTSQATGTSGSMLNISKAKFEESELIFPDIGSQKKFAEIYWKIQNVFSKLNQSGVCSFDSFNSLSQKAFTAEL
ncbi:restriction endonuclease subunit S [Methylicorpusculum sp.]|uniref:restriction endonuclease subunit S n=1 Tax=Methylicorpusculum sp. TaxID=2713644 RepID=UPI0027252FA4|nr:restriction endonuclease subunit S [Methylicorpusculum sp.]MDO8844085.1 restriction endonuclease subunit S [Methylicorpusculum sp.]